MAASKKPAAPSVPSLSDALSKEDSYIGHSPDGSTRAATGEVAPEVSQGAWRERVFTPRGVMSPEDVVQGLESSLRVVLASANHPRVAFEEVRTAWLPFLRQAVEQAGGDGLDAWLLTALKPPGRTPQDAFVYDLVQCMGRLRAAKDLALFEEEGLKAIELVRRFLTGGSRRRLSFKQMERELEGKLEVDELMQVMFSDESELSRRVEEIGRSMESLRDQIKAMPGKQPTGMYSNFVRLKATFRVVDAELKRRGGGSGQR